MAARRSQNRFLNHERYMIKIAQRLKPFSHTPGISCPIPGTLSILTAYPTLLKLDDQKVELPFTGPVEQFTVELDLEKSAVFVFGRAKEGYFRLQISANSSGFQIKSEKGIFQSLKIQKEISFRSLEKCERLSLGSHKSQDWDLVKRRLHLKEILPTLFLLGQKLPHIPPQPLRGIARLLQLNEERKNLEKALLSFFMAGFSNMLAPRLFDDQFQGIIAEETVEGEPFFLLQEGAKVIRSLFFTQKERRLAFLPKLPISFDAGRMVNLNAPGIGEIDFEWSKKQLKKVNIYCHTEGEVILELQKEIQSFRVNKKGKIKRGEPLFLEKNKTIYLDRFEK